MDNITHSLTGLMLSRAGLNRVSPQATWLLLLAANAPDVDLPSALGGSLTYLHYHRFITHSLVFLPLLPLACVAVVRLFARRPLDWKRAYLVALVGVASHLILDLTNIYGVRLLLPFSGRWFRLDTTSVVDPWIWLILILAVLGPALGRLVQSEMGAPAAPPGRLAAILALAVLFLYDGGRYLLHERAVATLASRMYGGAEPLRVAALPNLHPLHWRALVETTDANRIQEMDLAAEFDPAAGRIFYKPERNAAIERASQTGVVQEFMRFSQYPMWQTSPGEPEGTTRVEVMDLRFCDPPSPRFVATVILDSRLQVIRAWFAFGATR